MTDFRRVYRVLNWLPVDPTVSSEQCWPPRQVTHLTTLYMLYTEPDCDDQHEHNRAEDTRYRCVLGSVKRILQLNSKPVTM